ncbi:MAG: MBL fold metallo-hydrolase [Alphaproteobacteria bacterium]|nr:MBL fold metallo-hydrolase [Alphaproteobacteria bacterium]
MKVTILGCGASGGVPVLGGANGEGDWGECDPAEPRNRRMRASILVEEGDARILVDTSPDLRFQCLRFGIVRLDAVLYTHDHADHTHGIDELRRLHYLAHSPVKVFGDRETLASVTSRFAYAFAPADPSYRPFATAHEINGPFTVGGIPVTPYPQYHGNVTSLGFRFGPIAYSTDLVGLPEESYETLRGVKIWIVDCLKRESHPTHAGLLISLRMLEKVRPERGVLTHMTGSLDYRTLAAELPAGIAPAYDGLVLEA